MSGQVCVANMIARTSLNAPSRGSCFRLHRLITLNERGCSFPLPRLGGDQFFLKFYLHGDNICACESPKRPALVSGIMCSPPDLSRAPLGGHSTIERKSFFEPRRRPRYQAAWYSHSTSWTLGYERQEKPWHFLSSSHLIMLSFLLAAPMSFPLAASLPLIVPLTLQTSIDHLNSTLA